MWIDLCWKRKKYENGKTISRKSLAKASAAKPLGKPPPRDEVLGLEPEIRFYELDDDYNFAEEEEAEILVIHNLILTGSEKRPIENLWLKV